MDSISYDPLELARDSAEIRGWEYEDSEKVPNILVVKIPSPYAKAQLCLHWYEEGDLLQLRIPRPLSIRLPSLLEAELLKLLNLVNSQMLVGSWFYEAGEEDEQPQLTWRHELHSNESSIDSEGIDELIQDSVHSFNLTYPAFMALLTAKPTVRGAGTEYRIVRLGVEADNALQYIDQSEQCGRA